VDDAVGLREQPRLPVRGRGGGTAPAEGSVQGVGQGGGPFGQGVDDGDPLGAEGERGVRDGRARAAGAQLHDPLQRYVGQPAGEGRGETGDVRVVADRAAVLEDDGVDRAQRLGLWGECVQVLDDELLAGVRDVEPVETEVAGGPHQIAHRLGRHPERVDVDQPVQQAKALPVALPLVQRRAERRADAGTDQSDEIRVLGHTGLPSGSLMYELVR
jgi:hypothetical protein